jgi:predicted RNA binding protein YcfA (HicA-like mRNA interferase family)
MNARVPAFSSNDIIRALIKLGFLIVTGGKGSHTKLIHPGYPGALTIPKSKTFGKGIRTAIIKQAQAMGADRDQLIQLL